MPAENNPLVSVICLCYNHEQFVIETLESVVNQTYTNLELIIVDDCSRDSSVEKINHWLQNNPNYKFIQNQQNLGNTKSFNIAAQHANGKYLIDLAADDLLLPNCVEKQVKAFETAVYKNLGLVYGNVQNINESNEILDEYFPVTKDDKVITKRPKGSIFSNVIDSGKTICSVSAMFTKEAFLNLNGFDENLAYEDLDFWIRLSKVYEIDFIDAVLVQKRRVSNSLGSQFHDKSYSKRINTSTLIILKKAYVLCASKTEYRNLLKRIHYEIQLNYKNKDFGLVFQSLLLKLKTEFKILF